MYYMDLKIPNLWIICFRNSVWRPSRFGPWELVPGSSHSGPPTPTVEAATILPTVPTTTNPPTATSIQSLTPTLTLPIFIKKQTDVVVELDFANRGTTQRPFSRSRPNFLGEIQTCGRSRLFPTSGGSSGRARAPAQGSWPLQYNPAQNCWKTKIQKYNIQNIKYSHKCW